MENIRKLYNGIYWNETINMMDFNQFHYEQFFKELDSFTINDTNAVHFVLVMISFTLLIVIVSSMKFRDFIDETDNKLFQFELKIHKMENINNQLKKKLETQFNQEEWFEESVINKELKKIRSSIIQSDENNKNMIHQIKKSLTAQKARVTKLKNEMKVYFESTEESDE